jgi:cyclohexyl-isocyanide hydratase
VRYERTMRWLYHVATSPPPDGDYAPASLAKEGFVHCSFRDAVAASARLYFPPGATLFVYCIDPRRLPARVEVAQTPRGPMPHVHGDIPRDAIREVIAIDDVDARPDEATGTRFGLVCFRGMTLLDLVGVWDPLSRIRTMGFDPSSTTEVVSAHDLDAWSGDGATLRVGRVRPELDAFDVLVIPGGPGAAELAKDDDAMAWLRRYPRNRRVVSVCTGALVLGAMGRLSGLRATTHASAMGALPAFGAIPCASRVVDEGQVVTSGGVTSGIDAGLHVVRALLGEAASTAIARQMEHAPR